MASGSPETSTCTAPQKHSPLCIAIVYLIQFARHGSVCKNYPDLRLCPSPFRELRMTAGELYARLTPHEPCRSIAGLYDATGRVSMGLISCGLGEWLPARNVRSRLSTFGKGTIFKPIQVNVERLHRVRHSTRRIRLTGKVNTIIS